MSGPKKPGRSRCLSVPTQRINMRKEVLHVNVQSIPQPLSKPSCDLSVGCSLGVSPRRIGGANHTSLRGPE